MLQRGEPANVFVYLIVAVIFASAVFLGSSAQDTSPQVTGAVVTPTADAPLCNGNGGVCITLGTLLASALAIGALELTRRRA